MACRMCSRGDRLRQAGFHGQVVCYPCLAGQRAGNNRHPHGGQAAALVPFLQQVVTNNGPRVIGLHLFRQAVDIFYLHNLVIAKVTTHKCGGHGVRIDHQDTGARSRQWQLRAFAGPGGAVQELIRDWQCEVERRTRPLPALGPDAALVRLHEAFADRQAQTGSLVIVTERGVNLVEFVEDKRQLVCRDARSRYR